MKRDYIYIIVIVLLMIAGFIVRNKYENEKKKSEGLESALSEKEANIEKLTNALGQEIYRKQAAELRIKDLEKAYPELAATLEEQFDVKIKNLKAYIQNQFQAMGTGTGTVVNNYHYDSASNAMIGKTDFNANDGFMNMDINLELKFDQTSVTTRSSSYKYTYTDTATTVIASNKKFFQFWKNEKLFSTTKFSNPNTSLVGATNILVNNYRDKRWSIGFSAGWGLVKVGDEVHTGWFAGPSVEYALFKF